MAEVSDGEFRDSATASVTVNNVAPVVDAGDDATIDEGDTFSSSGSFIDPGTDTWTATVDYGDGSGTQPLTLSDKTFSLNHAYGDNGTYTVTITVTDDNGGAGSDTATVTVNNVAPVVNAGPDIEVFAGDTVNFSGNFTDPGWLDSHTATWDFGDGTNQSGTVTEENEAPDATGTVTVSNIYYQEGSYTVTLTVTDDDGDSGIDTLVITVLPIPANIRFKPHTLNLRSEGKWVTVFVELPIGPSGQEWDTDLIDISTVLLNDSVPAVSDAKYGFVKNSTKGNPKLMFKFDRSLVVQVLQAGEEVEVVITGKVLYNGDYADFEGVTVIRVIDKGNEKSDGGRGNGNGKEDAPGQNKEPGNNANGKANGKDTAPGQNKEPGDNVSGKSKGKESALGQNK